MNASSRLVFFSPFRGTQKTLHDVKTALMLLRDPQIHLNVHRMLIFHDDSTLMNAKIIQEKARPLLQGPPDIQTHTLPSMNALMDGEVLLPLEDDDIFLASGSGSHIGLVLHNLTSNTRLLGKSLTLVHVKPHGKSLSVYRYNFSLNNIDVRHMEIVNPNPAQSLRSILEESNAEIGEIYGRRDTLSKDYRHMIELDSKHKSEYFRDLLMRHYRISIEKAGFKMEAIAGALLASMHSHFTEIYGNILFSITGETLNFQEEDILAMLSNGDLIWFSSKYSTQKATIRHECKRMLAALPINFPDKRVHRIVLTFSDMAKKFPRVGGQVIVTGLASLPSVLGVLVNENKA